ncbi:outer membrane beta-barrel protein [Thiobacillus sedimenti]|uniref:Outer membrane beta-barrel protein n=1 Tax=Thiobacillus sedimenti TaxID=3110231 RepID=A0ABZ1CFI9_9PROT|nr:outer membrane beta-barrel protein [Thiobacillus sp. SCUT-2]WRS37865.1 outer membrane beta-barrel protein [Thiobacillus sp. SCUT-2]
MRTMRLAAAAAAALSLSNPASAGFFDFTLSPYVGASAGRATADVTCPAGTACDDSDTAWKVYGGLEVNEFISMEVGYLDLGKVGYTGAKTGTRETNGMMLQLVGTYALNPDFTLMARGGMNILNTEVNGTIAGTANGNTGDTDVVWSLGLGAQYNVTQSVGLRVEWERYFNTGSPAANGGTGEADDDLLSAGVVFKF